VLLRGVGEDSSDGVQIPEALFAMGSEVVTFSPIVPVIQGEQFAAQLVLRQGGNDGLGLAQQAFKVSGRNAVDRPFVAPPGPPLRDDVWSFVRSISLYRRG
jgi:hypothetical protein